MYLDNKGTKWGLLGFSELNLMHFGTRQPFSRGVLGGTSPTTHSNHLLRL